MITAADPVAGEFSKQAGSVEDADRLRREARVLAAASHPGVVQLRSFDGRTLREVLVASQPLSELAPPPAEAARIALSIATTLADLHEIGVTHGALSADHILVPPAGDPVLCSFGRGDATGGLPPPTEAQAADVLALATTLVATGALPEPVARLLAPIAAGGGRPPSARRLANRLGDRLGASEAGPARARPALARPARARPARGRPGAGVPARWWGVAAVATAAVLLASVAVAPRSGNGRPARTSPPAGPPIRHVGPTTSMPACPPVDLGCLPVALDGGVLATAGGRYRIGSPGDVVVVGRWGCASALPALLQPGSGEVWAWPVWAKRDEPAAARLVAHIEGAYSLRVGQGTRGCDFLQVLERGGRTVAIDPVKSA